MEILLIVLVLVLIGLNVFLIYKLILSKEKDTSVYLDMVRIHLENQKEMFKDEIGQVKTQGLELNSLIRKDLTSLFSDFNGLNIKSINEISKSNAEQMERLRLSVESSLKNIQSSNEVKLDEMRKTVDDKLNETLEKRLSSSFERVSKQLEMVYKSMGEVKQLANGVGDLKNVLSNVKARGGWGEVQLEILIEDMLAKNQFEKNYRVGTGTVEFAIKMPGKYETPIYLPIDSKFPMEDYNRVIAAQKSGDMAMLENARKSLAARFKDEGKKISQKYINPPQTTEFAIMFLPVEGLYAEAIQGGLLEELQNRYRVVITGPATLAALLNSLQMGFKTLAIEQKSAQVWKTLADIKKGFSNFSVALDKTRKTLETAQNHLNDASTKTRTIQTKLRKVEIIDEVDTPLDLE